MISKTSAALVALAFATCSVFADVFTYSDHWPSGTGDETATEVVVPDNTTATIATAEDVTRVARLTAISLDGSSAKVDYTASDALALSASVSGSGKFSAISSGNLTLSGDNSGLLSPGCFFFSNTAVTVASRYGLGSTGTAALHYWFGGKVDPFHFTGAGLTNDAPIHVHQGTVSENFVLGPDNAGETLVISNDFIFTGGSGVNKIWFRNKTRFVGGTFGEKDYKHIYSGVKGDPAEVWFANEAKIVCYFWYAVGKVTFHIGWAGFGTWAYNFSLWQGDPSTLIAICDKDDVFKSLSSHISGVGTFDLNGHNQTVKKLSRQYGSPTVFTSATPATLTVTTYDSGDWIRIMSANFLDKAAFTYSISGTNTLTTASTSSGALTVTSKALVLTGNSSWAGDVEVANGGELQIEAVEAISGGTSDLTVAEGGLLVLKEGVVCTVKSATIAGTALDAGDLYTVSRLRDEMHLPVDGHPAAAINVAGPSEWSGWPTEPGARAFVPPSTTVYVSDDDVETVEQVGKIFISEGSSVICTNLTKPLFLSAQVSGIGGFRAVDCGRIVLEGDNSGLIAPGAFFFTNTFVAVSNRYGLGSFDTGECTYYYGDLSDSFRFGGAGLTNDVAINIHQGTQDRCFVVGPENLGETMVYNNSFRYDGGLNAKKDVFIRNKIRFRGGRVGEYGWNQSRIYLWNDSVPAEVWIENDAILIFYYLYLAGGTWHFDWSAMERGYRISPWFSTTHVTCYRDNMFTGLRTDLGGAGTFDMNGHDQTLPLIYDQSATALFTVRSSAPATLTMSSSKTDSTIRSKFEGDVGLVYDLLGTNTYSTTFAETTGPLEIRRNVVKFTGGAGWGGTNVTIRSGARLIVADDKSSAVAFGSKQRLGHSSHTMLDIEEGGVMELSSQTVPVVVRSFRYNGTFQPAGFYTRSSGVGIDGPGTLRVRSSTDREPGAMVIVR